MLPWWAAAETSVPLPMLRGFPSFAARSIDLSKGYLFLRQSVFVLTFSGHSMKVLRCEFSFSQLIALCPVSPTDFKAMFDSFSLFDGWFVVIFLLSFPKAR